MEITTANIQSVIQKAKTGDQAAFTALLNHFWNEVYGFMFKQTANETDAEDITIETFSKAFDKINTYNEQFKFNTWLISIAKNVHIDMIRKRKSTQFVEIDENNENFFFDIIDDSPSIEDQLIQEQKLLTLKQYIKQLKPHYQEIIQLRFFQELSYNEISEKLEEPIGNVKVKLLRAKKLLTELIQKK